MILSENRKFSQDYTKLIIRCLSHSLHIIITKNFKTKFKDKKRALKIGKNFLERRLSGQFDKNLPYIPLSNFHNKKINLTNKKLNSKKGKIFIFPHCYFDSHIVSEE